MGKNHSHDHKNKVQAREDTATRCETPRCKRMSVYRCRKCGQMLCESCYRTHDCTS